MLVVPFATCGDAIHFNVVLTGRRSITLDSILIYYTPNSYAALTLLKMQQQYKEDNADKQVVFIGDMNVHNNDWICSVSPTDPGGLAAQEFCELYGMHQLDPFSNSRGQHTGCCAVGCHRKGSTNCWFRQQ